MSSPTTVARPGSVTFVVALTWIVAVVSILGGVIALLLSEAALAEAGIEKSTAVIYGAFELVLGVVIALVATGLSRGSNVARMLVSILMAIRIAVGVWAMIQIPSGMITGVATIAAALLILFLLWNQKANAFFQTN